MSKARGVLVALDAAIASVIATATRQLPAPASIAEEIGQAELMLRLQQARSTVADLFNAPAPGDPSMATVGADATAAPGAPALTLHEIAVDYAGLR
jgi:hypothetical protein